MAARGIQTNVRVHSLYKPSTPLIQPYKWRVKLNGIFKERRRELQLSHRLTVNSDNTARLGELHRIKMKMPCKIIVIKAEKAFPAPVSGA